MPDITTVVGTARIIKSENSENRSENGLYLGVFSISMDLVRKKEWLYRETFDLQTAAISELRRTSIDWESFRTSRDPWEQFK